MRNCVFIILSLYGTIQVYRVIGVETIILLKEDYNMRKMRRFAALGAAAVLAAGALTGCGGSGGSSGGSSTPTTTQAAAGGG